MTEKQKPTDPGPIKKLDPTILAAAQRANPAAVAATRAVLAAEAAAEAAHVAGDQAAAAAGIVQRRTVVINAAPKARGHARKFVPALQQQYLDLLRKAVTPPQAAQAVGVSSATIRAYGKADPEFGEAVRAARADATSPIVEAMWELALSGSFNAQKYLLENMAPDDWKDPKSIKVEVSGQIESITAEGRAGQIERIQRLQDTLAERLALRAAGDEIEAGQTELIEDAELVEDAGQIEDTDDELGEDDEPYGDRDFRRDVGY